MLPALANEGVESKILTTSGGLAGEPKKIEGIEHTAYSNSFLARLWTGLSFPLTRAMGATVRQFDVVHIHELWNYPHFAAARACIKADIPYVLSPHGELEPWALAHKGLKKRLYMSAIQRRYLNKAARIQALTEAEAALVKLTATEATTSVIPNGLDIDTIDAPPTQQVPQSIQHFLNNYQVITFMGRLHEGKGIEPLLEGFIEACKKSPSAALLFVGPDEDNYASSIESRARDAGLSDRVMVAGSINGTERFEILRQSSAFALMSYSEGFSMAILEALTCSTPIIISPACHFPEAIDAGAGVLAEPEAKPVSKAISKLLGDQELCNSMGAAGRRLIEERYTIQRVARLMAKTYADVI